MSLWEMLLVMVVAIITGWLVVRDFKKQRDFVRRVYLEELNDAVQETGELEDSDRDEETQPIFDALNKWNDAFKRFSVLLSGRQCSRDSSSRCDICFGRQQPRKEQESKEREESDESADIDILNLGEEEEEREANEQQDEEEEEWEEDYECCTLSCRYRMHLKCIMRWGLVSLKKGNMPTCPLYRSRVSGLSYTAEKKSADKKGPDPFTLASQNLCKMEMLLSFKVAGFLSLKRSDNISRAFNNIINRLESSS